MSRRQKIDEPATVIIGPEPETVELGEATVRDGEQVWMDGEFLGFHGKLKPGKWRIVAMRVG